MLNQAKAELYNDGALIEPEQERGKAYILTHKAIDRSIVHYNVIYVCMFDNNKNEC